MPEANDASKAKFPPASLHEFGIKTAVEPFGKHLHTRLLANFGRYQSQGFGEIRRLWQAHCGWVGREIEVSVTPNLTPLGLP